MRFSALPSKIVLLGMITGIMGSVCFGQSYWRKTFEESSFSNICPTTDGNFLFARGSSLLKINICGDTLWMKTYKKSYHDEIYAICATSDSNFLLAGSTTTGSILSNLNSAFLQKINSNGDTLWTKIFREAAGQEAFHGNVKNIISTSDGNYILVGQKSFEGSSSDGWVLKVNPNGDTLWTKTFGGEGFDLINTIYPTTDNNFLLGGVYFSTSNSTGEGQSHFDGWLLKINLDGDTLWTKTYRGKGGEYNCISSIATINSIAPTTDGNFLIAGDIDFNNSNGGYEGWLQKIQPNGDTLWTKIYGSAAYCDYFQKIIPTIDGNFLVLGYVTAGGNSNNCIVKINFNGDTLWTKNNFKTRASIVSVITQTMDGNFIFAQDTNLLYLVDDRYVYRDSLFTFKIPCLVPDSLGYGYVPLRVPPGMTVSSGGTISWTPETDSVYMEHVEYIVLNDNGRKDTLTFNLFVNSYYGKVGTANPAPKKILSMKPFSITTTCSNGRVTFLLPSSVSTFNIYNIAGCRVDRLSPMTTTTGSYAIWPDVASGGRRFPAGKYFAKMAGENGSGTKPFLLVQ